MVNQFGFGQANLNLQSVAPLLAALQRHNQTARQNAFGHLGAGINQGVGSIVDALQRNQARRDAISDREDRQKHAVKINQAQIDAANSRAGDREAGVMLRSMMGANRAQGAADARVARAKASEQQSLQKRIGDLILKRAQALDRGDTNFVQAADAELKRLMARLNPDQKQNFAGGPAASPEIPPHIRVDRAFKKGPVFTPDEFEPNDPKRDELFEKAKRLEEIAALGPEERKLAPELVKGRTQGRLKHEAAIARRQAEAIRTRGKIKNEKVAKRFTVAVRKLSRSDPNAFSDGELPTTPVGLFYRAIRKNLKSGMSETEVLKLATEARENEALLQRLGFKIDRGFDRNPASLSGSFQPVGLQKLYIDHPELSVPAIKAAIRINLRDMGR